MRFLKPTLRGGLIAVLALFAFMLLALGLKSHAAMQQSRAAFDSLNALNVERLGVAREVYAELMQTRVLLDSYQTDYNRLRVKQARATWEQAEGIFAQARGHLDALPSDETKLHQSFQALIEEGLVPGFDALAQWNVSSYQRSVQQSSELTAALDADLRELTQRAELNARQGAASMARNAVQLQFSLALALALSVIAMIGTFFLSKRCLLQPLGQVRGHLGRIAEGDLSAPLAVRGAPEMRQLAMGVNAMHQSLRELVERLQAQSVAMRQDASQLTGASQTLHDQSQDQASALQQTSASMEEITAMVTQTADLASQGQQLADENRRRFEEGRGQLSSASAEMDKTQARSKASLEAVALLDSLAFQTNLLALNASVEAARAGEQGRGFSVVAAEVRKLSTRSAEAARSIRKQLEGTHQQVQQSGEVFTRAAETLASAAQSSQRLGELLEGIAQASQQQRDGIQQVDAAISTIDSATQRNVTLSEQTFQAVRELDLRARQQSEHAAAFRLAPAERETVGGSAEGGEASAAALRGREQPEFSRRASAPAYPQLAG